MPSADTRPKWWRRPGPIVTLLIFLPPLGLALAFLAIMDAQTNARPSETRDTDRPARPQWWRRTGPAAVLLVAIPPAGMVLAFLTSWPRRRKAIACALSGLWLITVLASRPDTGPAEADQARPEPEVHITPNPPAAPTPQPSPTRPEDVTWATCEEAWAGGVPRTTGLVKGIDRGYSPALDTNGDTIACATELPEIGKAASPAW